MKKAIAILLTGFVSVVLLSMCDQSCDLPLYYLTRIDGLDAKLCQWESDVGNFKFVRARNLRLRINFDLVPEEYLYAFNPIRLFPTAYAFNPCLSFNRGLIDKVVSLSLTCDKTVGGYDAGTNLLENLYDYPYYNTTETGENVGWGPHEWITMFNTGNDMERNGPLPDATYEFYATTLLADPAVPVVEDEYVFTFKVTYDDHENNYSKTFPPVRLR